MSKNKVKNKFSSERVNLKYGTEEQIFQISPLADHLCQSLKALYNWLVPKRWRNLGIEIFPMRILILICSPPT
jgi:hypothetical protein